MYYVSYMTLYEIQEIFSTSMENQNYTVFSLLIFLYDPWTISRKSYMFLVWLPRIHTNYIWPSRPSMITKNHIWPSTKSKKVVWSLTRVATKKLFEDEAHKRAAKLTLQLAKKIWIFWKFGSIIFFEKKLLRPGVVLTSEKKLHNDYLNVPEVTDFEVDGCRIKSSCSWVF